MFLLYSRLCCAHGCVNTCTVHTYCDCTVVSLTDQSIASIQGKAHTHHTDRVKWWARGPWLKIKTQSYSVVHRSVETFHSIKALKYWEWSFAIDCRYYFYKKWLRDLYNRALYHDISVKLFLTDALFITVVSRAFQNVGCCSYNWYWPIVHWKDQTHSLSKHILDAVKGTVRHFCLVGSWKREQKHFSSNRWPLCPCFKSTTELKMSALNYLYCRFNCNRLIHWPCQVNLVFLDVKNSSKIL